MNAHSQGGISAGGIRPVRSRLKTISFLLRFG